MKNLFTSKKGFTLIEIILVVTLTMFLLVATMQSLLGSTAQLTFINTSDKVLDLIRQARSLAISGKSQVDYTDFDKDGCADAVTPSCTSEDYVTPAHYGVRFHASTGGTDPDTVTLFADNHSVNQIPKEGQFDDPGPTPTGTQLHNGYDIILEKFVLPPGIHLSNLPSKDTSIFYSPIFADVSFDQSLAVVPQFFTFNLQQTANSITRARCYRIHKLSGISEPSPQCP